MTYDEVFEWIDDSYDFESYEDLGEFYQDVSNDWFGRNDFDTIISLDEFFNHYEG